MELTENGSEAVVWVHLSNRRVHTEGQKSERMCLAELYKTNEDSVRKDVILICNIYIWCKSGSGNESRK